MARVKGNNLSGTIGNIVFRQIKGKTFAQAKTARGFIRQTKNTVRSGLRFGTASKMGKSIRELFGVLNQDMHSPDMDKLLNGKLTMILSNTIDKATGTYHFEPRSFLSLTGFEFNAGSPLQKSLIIQPACSFASGVLRVDLPELTAGKHLKFPGQTRQCTILLHLALYNLTDGHAQLFQPPVAIPVPHDGKKTGAQQFSFNVPEGCLALAGLSLKYEYLNYGQLMPYNHKEFNPSAIIGTAVNPGKFSFDKKIWHRSSGSTPSFGEDCTAERAE